MGSKAIEFNKSQPNNPLELIENVYKPKFQNFKIKNKKKKVSVKKKRLFN